MCIPEVRWLGDLWNNPVRLTHERLLHILEHPEMRGEEAKIQETLVAPDVVIQSRADDAVQVYYRSYRDLRIGDKFLAVVVKSTNIDRFIVTAYFTDQPKRGVVLWTK